LNKKDFGAGVIFIIVSIAMFLTTYTFPITPVQGAGPAFWPRLLSVLLFILSIFLILGSFKGKGSTFYGGKINIKPYIGILLSILYFLLFRKIGFVVATFFYFCGLSLLTVDSKKHGLLNFRSLILMVGQSVIMLGIVYFLFKVFLRVNLPRGIFF